MKAQPGPWAASEMRMDAKLWASLNGDHELTIVRTNWDGFTGDVVAAVWADDDHDELATAHVIAAAPDLLAALEAMVLNDSHAYRDCHKAAVAAIAKARGQ